LQTRVSELLNACVARGLRITEIEVAGAIGALVDNGRAEILPALRLLRRGGRNAPRYGAT
jgi:hypothetical protein